MYQPAWNRVLICVVDRVAHFAAGRCILQVSADCVVLLVEMQPLNPLYCGVPVHANVLYACPTRLETRTEESRACASSSGGILSCKMNVIVIVISNLLPPLLCGSV